jgi:hypothetical protein
LSSPTQINRPFRVKTSLGDDALLLDSFSGVERVSEPFRFVLRLLSPDPNVDMQSLLTQPVVLSLQLDDDSERHIHGNISRMKLLHYGSDGKPKWSPGSGFSRCFPIAASSRIRAYPILWKRSLRIAAFRISNPA